MYFHHKIPSQLNRKIGKAMHDYTMFEDGDRVIVAVSGGIDSLTLGCILQIWQQKVPIHFQLIFIHIDHGFWRLVEDTVNPEISIGSQLERFGVGLQVYDEWDGKGQERKCFSCSRNRRSQLFNLARKFDCNKIAFGHHKDDLVETFFLNSIYSGNISTMKPRQNLFQDKVSIVRPMVYLEKYQVVKIAEMYGLKAVKNLCPYAQNSKREKIRDLLENLYRIEPSAKDSVFAALSNVRTEYLL